MRHRLLAAALVCCVAPPLAAQRVTQVQGAVLTESYSFDAGLVFNKISETTVPVGLTAQFGRSVTATLSTGYARVSLTSADASLIPNQSVSGALDTQLRLGFTVVPGRLILLATGVLPTGIKTVQQEQLSILGALSSDVIGFSAPSIGSGGGVGGGFAGAIPLGAWALGLGGTYRMPLAYQPIVGQTAKLKPGAEARLRVGLEGPLARTTYVRLAGIFATRAKDQVASQPQNGVGNRFIGYVSVNQGLGSAALTVYGFDVYRAAPQVQATATGAAILPRGNLIAVGSRLGIPLGVNTQLAPRVEYRHSAAATDTTANAPVQRLGASFRFGVDVRQTLSPRFTVVLQAGGATGSVTQSGADVNFSGYRAGLQLEVKP
jgi:hypothetical protein